MPDTQEGRQMTDEIDTAAVLSAASEGVLVVDDDWQVTYANDAGRALLEVTEDELLGADVREAFPASIERPFHEQIEATSGDEAATFEEYFPELSRWLSVRTVPRDAGVYVYIRDVTDRREREQDLAALEQDRETLHAINDIIQEVIAALVGVTSREAIEETVCERLAASDLYEFAWVGEREMAGDRLTVRTTAGESDEMLDRIVETSDRTGTCPEQRAIETGEPQVIEHLPDDDSVPEPVRWEAFSRGLQSSIAVPIVYGDATYGVLGVYASGEEAFSDRGDGGFVTLARTIGFAINAAKQRNILLSDTVVELRFQVSDPGAFFVSASAELDCSITVEGIVPQDEDALIAYVSLEGATGSEFAAVTEDAAAAETSRIVHEDEDANTAVVEVRLTGASPILTLANYGATVRTAVFDGGTGRIVAELDPEEDVRRVVEAVSNVFPETELLAKRERERAVETAQEFRSTLHEELTDRQLTALRTAYFADYFESPRGSTAEEIADALGVSSPTFHHHLRAAERRLLSAFFSDTDESPQLTDANTDRL